jgi:dolichol-phosphate mannosyltransferase
VDADRYLIVLPTYNERDNLPRVVDAIAAVRQALPMPGDVLVVDDGSPDGTGKVADELAAEHPWVSVLHRTEKRGLGPAYLAGFRRALAGGAEYVATMDADFSHDPRDLPMLLAALAENDVAIGSRYVPGGGIRHWGRLRRGISRGGTLYARGVLGVPVRDLTSGFKCFRREVLEAIDLDRISSVGYAFQIETVYRALAAGFRVCEVPIVFSDRTRGGSKMSRGIVLEAVAKVPALRVRALRGRL